MFRRASLLLAILAGAHGCASRPATPDRAASPRILLSTTEIYAHKLPAAQTPPARLYRPLPLNEGMGLLASLPPRDIVVAGAKFEVTVDPPAADDRIVLLYDRIDGAGLRYGATVVRHRARDVPLPVFAEEARRWTEERFGKHAPIPGSFAHFTPTWREWRSLIESGGILALVPPNRSRNDFDPKLIEQAHAAGKAGVVCRAPLDRWPASFVQIEILRADVTPHAWSSFESFCETRRLLSARFDAAISTLRIGEWLRETARQVTASDSAGWVLLPGAAFGDGREWWGTRRPRLTVHEGIDLRFLSVGGERKELAAGAVVTAVADGEVVRVFKDFIGQTVVVRHRTGVEGGSIYTVYAHAAPRPDRTAPYPVKRGERIAEVAASATGAPSHLHFTVLYAPDWLPVSRLDWDTVNPNFVPVMLLDPLQGIAPGRDSYQKQER
ncbi:MAG: M23 family metallopeptidase [Planctomycetes bacterium]|nr:M23 family metallopeptidase [Planctomycetota bacterium]